jgi:hypothetical protein
VARPEHARGNPAELVTATCAQGKGIVADLVLIEPAAARRHRAEIVEDPEAALAQFAQIATTLRAGPSEESCDVSDIKPFRRQENDRTTHE